MTTAFPSDRASAEDEPNPWLVPESVGAFSESARQAVYDAIALRRDVRHFQPNGVVSDEVLQRILGAAHLAPSVGFSQPWGFVVIRDVTRRERIRESFLRCREAEAARYPAERRGAYLAHKLEGILESSVNVCVAVDLRSRGEAILGTTVQPESVRASACCAVQNLWLAARVEGIGVGWVSIVEPTVLRHELSLPPGVEPIAYLCLGHAAAFRDRPMLEETGWRRRRPLDDVVHPDGAWRDDRVEALSSVDPAGTRPELDHQPPQRALDRSRAFLPPGPIHVLSESARDASRTHQALLTKPIGSLGRLEDLAAWYAAVRGDFPCSLPKRATLALFAADHGVVVEGVSAYGSGVTAAMVGNVMAGGAAINALADEFQVKVLLVDVGVSGDLSAASTSPRVKLVSECVRRGTGNMRTEPAMTVDEAEQALSIGRRIAAAVIDDGTNVLALGEIGIGNTTAASALVAHYLDVSPAAVVGFGTGIDEQTRLRKVSVVEASLALHRREMTDPARVLACVGGLEIAAMAGAALEAARRRIPVVLDGFVTQAAALSARAIDPGVVAYLLASHVSREPGSRVALEALGLSPLFDLGLRLGEGTGAVLGVATLRAAVVTERRMATFATAGIVDRLSRR